jgi:hypothetical protein
VQLTFSFHTGACCSLALNSFAQNVSDFCDITISTSSSFYRAQMLAISSFFYNLIASFGGLALLQNVATKIILAVFWYGYNQTRAIAFLP